MPSCQKIFRCQGSRSWHIRSSELVDSLESSWHLLYWANHVAGNKPTDLLSSSTQSTMILSRWTSKSPALTSLRGKRFSGLSSVTRGAHTLDWIVLRLRALVETREPHRNATACTPSAVWRRWCHHTGASCHQRLWIDQQLVDVDRKQELLQKANVSLQSNTVNDFWSYFRGQTSEAPLDQLERGSCLVSVSKALMNWMNELVSRRSKRIFSKTLNWATTIRTAPAEMTVVAVRGLRPRRLPHVKRVPTVVLRSNLKGAIPTCPCSPV